MIHCPTGQGEADDSADKLPVSSDWLSRSVSVVPKDGATSLGGRTEASRSGHYQNRTTYGHLTPAIAVVNIFYCIVIKDYQYS